MEHVFGPPPHDGLGIGDRICTEPLVPKVQYTRVFHVTFELLPHGDVKCLHCGARFHEEGAS